jgi:antitoxin VapB
LCQRRGANILEGKRGYPDMPLYIKDNATAQFVGELARRRKISKQEAVRVAVSAELKREDEKLSLRERVEKFWRENPMPPPTGQLADKAFFDELSGEDPLFLPTRGHW